jgi:dTDP-4-dehydrorhamnose 3,5-epimerase
MPTTSAAEWLSLPVVDVVRMALPGVLLIRPPRHQDERGFFSEVWSRRSWAEAGIACDFVQDNHSLSRRQGVLRGLHYQLPPADQDKVIRVSRGRIFDVAVDIRRSSPTFGQWVGTMLSAEEGNQLLVPSGFAHGFVTLEPDTEVQYRVTSPYSPVHERAIRWDDPAIGIDWPLPVAAPMLSARDRAAPRLGEAELFA